MANFEFDYKSFLKSAGEAVKSAGETAGAAAKTAGVTARAVAKSAGTVVGIGIGTMSIRLVRTVHEPGDIVRGRLQMTLPEPLEARRLVVGIRARQRYYEIRRDAHGNRRREQRERDVYSFESELDGAHAYSSEGFDFRLGVPGRRAPTMPSGLLGDVATVLGALKNTRREPLRWSIYGFLDRPWKVNLKCSVALNVAG